MSRFTPVVLLLLTLALPVAQSDPPAPIPQGFSPPIVLLLQPDAANGTDTAIVESTPAWNLGTSDPLWVGVEPASVNRTRALLRFDVTALPAAATIVDAALELYESSGNGTLEVRRATAPWSEGSGARSWSSLPFTVSETAGVPRALEPVRVRVSFPPGSIADPARDLRLWSGNVEVPSQVYAYAYSGIQVSAADLYFSASLAALGSAQYSLTFSTNETAVPGYRTRSFGASPRWTWGPVGTGASGVTVADLDRDGLPEVLFGTASGLLVALDGNGTERWSAPLSATRSVPFAPQVQDLDGDGSVDIIVVTNEPSVLRLNDTGGVVWTAPFGVPDLPLSTPTLLDVNGDGVRDVLIGGKARRIDALNGTDGSIILSYPAGDWTYTPTVVDLDADGLGEVLFGSDDYLVHAVRANGSVLWASAPPWASFIENSVAVGDADGDGSLEVFTGDDLNNGPEFALDAATGAFRWSTNFSSYREGGQTLADLNGDGGLELLLGLFSGPFHALRATDGSVLWTYAGGAPHPSTPAVVDVTNDGVPEILYVDDAAVRVLDSTGVALQVWNITLNDQGLRSLSQRPMVTPAVADLDGDGTMEVVVPTGAGVTAFPTGGLARDWRTFGYNWNHTHRALDGSSPDGAAPLQAIFGAGTVHPALGASWEYRDGVIPWTSPGGDFGPAEASAGASPGWISLNVTGMVRDWYAGLFPNVGLVLTAADEVSGDLHVLASSDAADPAQRPQLRITYVLPLLDPNPRILGTIPDQSFPEDSPPWTLNLNASAADEDTPAGALRWNVSGLDPAAVQVSGLNTPGMHLLTFYPQPDAWGAFRVTYWLTDPQGNADRFDAWINLTAVDDAPTLNPPLVLVVRHNVTYTFDFGPYITDPDTARGSLTLATDDPVHAVASGFNVSFTYGDEFLGQWMYAGLILSDGTSAVGKVVVVKVTPDDPPTVSLPLPDLTLTEGEVRAGVFDLDDYFLDPNNDALYFSFGYSHLTITIHANHSVDILAQTEWFGVEIVTFRGTDPDGALAEDQILVTVIPTDDPPALAPLPALRVRFDENYTFNLGPYISDPDTPPDRINASTSSPWISVSGHLLTLRFPASLNGTTVDVTVWISDGRTPVSANMTVAVGYDRPPVLRVKLPDREFLEDASLRSAYALSVFFQDPDSDPLYYSAGNQHVTVAIGPGGEVDLAAEPDWFGTERITFRAEDPEGALAEDSVWVRVLPVNDAPRFGAVPPVVLNGTTGFLDLAPYLFDVDTNRSVLVLSTQDGNVTVVGQGLLFDYPAVGTDHTDRIQLLVSDGALTNSTEIVVTVPGPSAPHTPPAPLPWWLLAPGAAIVVFAYAVYHWKRLEWAFLVTNGGLLVSSTFREAPAEIDTDLVTGMLTAIMSFSKESFSDETSRELEGLSIGDRRVTIVRGKEAYLAVVYQGRSPGGLPRRMRNLLDSIEAGHPTALAALVDTSQLGDIPTLLQRFLDRGWLPFSRVRDRHLPSTEKAEA